MQDEKVICRLPLAFSPISGVSLVHAPEGGIAFRLLVDGKLNNNAITDVIPITEKQLELVMKLVERHGQAFTAR